MKMHYLPSLSFAWHERIARDKAYRKQAQQAIEQQAKQEVARKILEAAEAEQAAKRREAEIRSAIRANIIQADTARRQADAARRAAQERIILQESHRRRSFESTFGRILHADFTPAYTDLPSIRRAYSMLPTVAQSAAHLLSDYFVADKSADRNDLSVSELTAEACAAAVHSHGLSTRTQRGQLAAVDLYHGYGQDIFDVGWSEARWTITTGEKISSGIKTTLKIAALGAFAAFGIWGG